MTITIYTTVELAERLGTSPSSISRAAKRAGVGVRRQDGRLVGVEHRDIEAIRRHLHYTAGNPGRATE